MAKRAKQPVSSGSGDAEKKKRTREHVIAELSVNFVERLALKCGYAAQRPSPDYGFDLLLETITDKGEVENELIPLQLKATDASQKYELAAEQVFSFPVNIKDYTLWIKALMPVFLILFDALWEEAYWVDIQDYENTHKPDVTGATLNLRIPRSHVLGVQTIRMMRQRKNARVESLRATLKGKTIDE